MAFITSAGTYGPSSFALRSGMSVSSRLGKGEAALTEASGAMDRAEISREAAKLVADSRPSQLVQVLSSATGRTNASVSTMKELAPPPDAGAASQFKGTKALVDSRAAAAARMRNIDLTVGGPNSAGALKGAPIFKAPEPKPEQTQLGRAKITQAQAEEKARAIAEARVAARDAVQRLTNSGSLGVAEDITPKPAAGGLGGFSRSLGAIDAAPKFEAQTAKIDTTVKPERAEPEARDKRNDREEAAVSRRMSPVPGAFNAEPGATLNFLA